MEEKYYCWKCHSYYPKEKLYFNERAPHFNFCKECLNNDVQNDIIKAMPYLHNYRIPVYPEIWEYYKQKTKEKYNDNRSIFGYYLQRMKMCTWWGCDFLYFYDRNNEYPEVREAWEEYILNCIKESR